MTILVHLGFAFHVKKQKLVCIWPSPATCNKLAMNNVKHYCRIRNDNPWPPEGDQLLVVNHGDSRPRKEQV